MTDYWHLEAELKIPEAILAMLEIKLKLTYAGLYYHIELPDADLEIAHECFRDCPSVVHVELKGNIQTDWGQAADWMQKSFGWKVHGLHLHFVEKAHA